MNLEKRLVADLQVTVVAGVGWTKATSRVGLGAALEVWVAAGLFGGDASSWIVDEKSVKEIQSVIIQVGDERRVLTNPLWERALVVWKGCHSWPLLLSRGSEKPIASLVI